MASKESSRSAGLMAKLQALRDAPPGVVSLPAGKHLRIQNPELLRELKNFTPNQYHLSALIDVCVTLDKTLLNVSGIRLNRWGKYEILLGDMVSQLKSLKASAEEIEKLAWVVFPAYGDDQIDWCKQLCNEANPVNGKIKDGIADIKLIGVQTVRDTNAQVSAQQAGSFSTNIARKEVVYGKWQCIHYVTAPAIGGVFTVTPSGIVGSPTFVPAVHPGPVAVPEPPPKKRARKEKEKEKEKEKGSSAPLRAENELDGDDPSEPMGSEA